MRVIDWMSNARAERVKEDDSSKARCFFHVDWHERQGSSRYKQDQSKVLLTGKVSSYIRNRRKRVVRAYRVL